MSPYLQLTTDYIDPEQAALEIVERKGIGHPDTLADGLAEAVSQRYSHECLTRFGYVPHHNVDKLYVGGGLFRIGFGQCEQLSPIVVRVNGRMSASFADQPIDLVDIQQAAITPYLTAALTNVGSTDVVILGQPTQHTKVPHWFAPRGVDDLPEYTHLKANDTSVCIAHWPFTVTEQLALRLERFFWQRVSGVPQPRFNQFGLDVKVMACRQASRINVTMCVPVIATAVSNLGEYDGHIHWITEQLNMLAHEVVCDTPFTVSVQVNPYQRLYLLGTGSCVECGEEGLVGRGNSANGVISLFRPHSVEASSGKNPVYHTGRVLGYLTQRLARALSIACDCRCTVIAMTQNGHSLIPPHLLAIKADRPLDQHAVEAVIETDLLGVDYLKEILARPHTV